MERHLAIHKQLTNHVAA